MRNHAMTDREAYPAAWVLVGTLALAYLVWRYGLGMPTVSRCWVWEHWGVYCPGCGGTRAVIALAKEGSPLGVHWMGVALAALVFVLMRYTPAKKLHPIVFIAFSAVVGVIFQM